MAYDDYAYLWEALVPAGYILALPRTEGGLFPSHGEFGRDLAFLVRKLQQEGTNPASRFYGAVGATCAVMGHSMGGGASFLAAAEDPGITALANLAAAETSPSAIGAAAGITAPALMFAGSFDCVTPPAQHQIPMYEALASDCKTLVTITGASHCQFAEYDYLCTLGEGGCPTPGISRAVQHQITVSLLRPWLDFELRGDAAGWAEFEDLLAGGAGLTYLRECVPLAADEGPAPWGPVPVGGLRIAGAAPNPFVRCARIALLAGRPGPVAVDIVSPAGERVRRLAGHASAAGALALEWDGRDAAGRPLPAGLYFARAAGGPGSARLLLVR
jgi:hypothetical protein